MTLEALLEQVNFDNISLSEAKKEIEGKKKLINYFLHRENISQEMLSDRELMDLKCLVELLQILYTSNVGSPITDSEYDTLQELLVYAGVPRLTGSKEIGGKKLNHRFTTLRGTLDKVYYLFPDEIRKNPSRKYLDEWIKKSENLYKKNTGEFIDLNKCKVLLQCKFDGCSSILEIDNGNSTWLTRGDTENNLACDVTHIMKVFNDVFSEDNNCGIKCEVCMSEENLKKINELYRDQQYKNSRQAVVSTLNSKDIDYKVDYIYPIPLRIIHEGEDIEKIDPSLIKNFPTKICFLEDREEIKKFGRENRYAVHNGQHYRTDGVVITILDEKVQRALGRENNINNFEVALKNSEETCIAKVKDVIFETSQFGFIVPVLEIYPVIMKGNTVTRCSLSNKERFDELNLHYGDSIKISYDIIPVATIDKDCTRSKTGRKIEFIKYCPKCRSELDLDTNEVQCHNPDCPSKKIGVVWNYCQNLRIQNIGYSTLEKLYEAGLLNKGIRSLYKLKKKSFEMEELDGFGKLKSKKIISEIEAKRRLKDYEFFGSIGIESLSIRTFQSIFSAIKYTDFIQMIELKNFDLLFARLNQINGIGDKKSELIVRYFKHENLRESVLKLINELSIQETFGDSKKKIMVFSGFRSDELVNELDRRGWAVLDNWNNSASYLVVADENSTSSKVAKAKKAGIPIITREYLLGNIDRLQ